MSARPPSGARQRRLIVPDALGREGLALAFEAGAAEREALARRLDLLALETLAAELRFEPADAADGAGARPRERDDPRQARAELRGDARARAPRPSRIGSPVLYAPQPADRPAQEVEVAVEGETPEPLPQEGIDADAVVAEHLALLIDPYPRHPDAPEGPLTYAAGEDGSEEDARGADSPAGPFAALGQLKSKL